MRTKKHLKIYTSIVKQIKDGLLLANEKLPSTRELAKLHRCHRITVMTAMQNLVAEGWIESSLRSHYFVSSKIPILNSKEQNRQLTTNEPNFKIVRHKLNFDLERVRYPLEFWGGQPDLRLFPQKEFRSVVADSLKKIKPNILNYGHTDGLASLQKQVADYLRRTRSLTDKEFIITNGSQEALLLITQLFIKPGDAIAIEGLGYPPAWRVFESLGAKLIPIPVDQEGLDTAELQKQIKLKKIKMIYTTPLHQYPTTVTLSPRRRQQLIYLANKYQIPILEDDYDHEFHFTDTPPAPLATETNYAFYICSFSKVLFPGARLGVIGCSAKMKNEIAYQKFIVSRQTDCLSQLALSQWIKDGGFERHLRRCRRTYEQRFYFMQSQLEKLTKDFDIDWQTPNGGMSIWVNLKQNSKLVADAAKKKGAFFQDESTMNYGKTNGTHLRIGFAGVNEQEIKDGFKILSESMR